MRLTGALALGAIAALGLPAGAVAKPTTTDHSNAAKECRLERGDTDASKAAFAAKYANFGACVSARARAEAQERQEAHSNAARDCRAERKADPAAFAEKYGTNKNKRNAFGKCVSKKAKELKAAEDRQDKQEIAAGKKAAAECATERDGIGEQAFDQKYGTNKNKRNAFGKCVSAKSDEPESGGGAD